MTHGQQGLWKHLSHESEWVKKNCFGMIEWNAVRISASGLLAKHAAVTGWKHRALSCVEQEAVEPMPKYRGAEQGNVDGPLESSLALGVVTAEARLHAAGQQAAGIVSVLAQAAMKKCKRLQENS